MVPVHIVRTRLRIVTLIGMATLLQHACGDDSAPLSVDTTAPTVVLTLGTNNVTSVGNLDISATASDEVGIIRVEFYERTAGDVGPTKIGEDGSVPYSAERPILDASDNGNHEFTAKAYDAAGNVGTSNVVTVTINLDAGPPAFTISASHDHITTPGSITFTADATAGLTRLELYEHGIKVGESGEFTGAASVTADVTSQENGSRMYVAKGFGPSGEIGSSNQVPISVDIRWDLIRPLAEMSADHSVLLASDASGAAYVATTTRSESNAVIDLNVVLSRYDADGNRTWTQTFGGSDWESLYSVGVDPSGRVYISGYTSYRGEGDNRNPDCFLSVYDAAGNQLWTRVIGTALLDAVCVATTSSAGDFYLAGGVQEGNSSSGRTDILVTRYDAAGNEVWKGEFGSMPGLFGDDIPTSIAVDPQERVYVAGYTSGSIGGAPNQGGRDIFVVQLDRNGNRVWSRQFGTSHHDFANAVAADPDGGVYVAGGIDHPDIRFGPYGDALLLRYGVDGTLLWERKLDGGYFDDAWDVAADQNGVRVTGSTSRGTSGELNERTQGPSDAFLAEVSRNGNLGSVYLLGGSGPDGATGFAPGASGNTYVVLTTQGGLPGAPNAGAVLARQRPAGP